MGDFDLWSHKDEWKAAGSSFCVVVSRHGVKPIDETEGANRWCVYAYIYPKHPHFKAFDGRDMWQEAATIMPLHSGPSFLRYHLDEDGEVTSVQVGADYNHYGDDRYTHMAARDDAIGVFHDAEALFKWLADRAAIENAV